MTSEFGAASTVDAALLRGWPLPEPGSSKRERGDVLVVGGAARSPGAAQLAGLAALRVGAGRLTLAVGSSVASSVAVAVPECGVVPLEETTDGGILGRSLLRVARELKTAGSVLVGPGLDDVREARRLLRRLPALVPPDITVVLDAFALGALAGRPGLGRVRRRILTPNTDEAALLLGRDIRDLDRDVLSIARRYSAVVSCHGRVAAPNGRLLLVRDGGPGLGTSGSGDALAGAIAGLAARGCEPLQAAAWGTFLHAAAGESLAREVAPLGFLAGEIVQRLPFELAAVEGAG
ncbi:NAD(P)H-hydrate dehydratase [Leifsonia sp. NPDC058230]|uniref:NAD(P)H-hydrate dehydratase n=1 Tax=Leifsonia sp. NPDC058230 TaxID=3346391 RepID=UPI0036D9B7C0